MNILVIGSGGREHALAHKIYHSESVKKIFCNPGNPGTSEIAENVDFDFNNEAQLTGFCRQKLIDLVVVGPEQPLAAGITDMLKNNDILCFGPSKYAAQLESSKSYAKEFMKDYNIPTAAYKDFTDDQQVECFNYIDEHSLPIVIKADGLAGGKGVFVTKEKDEAKQIVKEIFSGKFGAAGYKIVIEEFLDGEEASVFAVCDGKDYLILPPSQDHKRALDGDKGLNTGGMGAYAPTPFIDEGVLAKVENKIIKPVLKGMNEKKNPYIGCLYCGLMIINGEPYVVEFNVRFGDPEAQSVLSLVEGDFAKLLYSSAEGNIDKNSVRIDKNKFSTTLILASKGYPESYEKGYEISGLKRNSELNNSFIFQAGTKSVDGKIVNNGGRVLGITTVADSLEKSRNIAYELAETIKYENKYYRSDIAEKALK